MPDDATRVNGIFMGWWFLFVPVVVDQFDVNDAPRTRPNNDSNRSVNSISRPINNLPKNPPDSPLSACYLPSEGNTTYGQSAAARVKRRHLSLQPPDHSAHLAPTLHQFEKTDPIPARASHAATLRARCNLVFDHKSFDHDHQ